MTGRTVRAQPGIELRPETAADRPFLERLFASTRDAELRLLGAPGPAQRAFVASQFALQAAHYRAAHPDAAFDVVSERGLAIGRFYVARGEREARLIDVSLLPEHRGRGIGTLLLSRLLDRARTDGHAVSLHVESGNPARRLYERLGFSAVGEHGVHVRMRWQAPR